LHYSERPLVRVAELERRAARRAERQASTTNGNGLGGDIDWGEILAAISAGFNGLADRVEALEAKVEELETGATNAVTNDKRFDVRLTRADSLREREVRTLRETSAGVRSELDALRLELRLLAANLMKREPQQSQFNFYVSAERY
jgi:hypothetical protein